MKCPSIEAFEKAINACADTRMLHLEIMARERYAVFLYEQKNEQLAGDYMISAYWMYQDWGAHAKALQLLRQYEFLKVSTFLFLSRFIVLAH